MNDVGTSALLSCRTVLRTRLDDASADLSCSDAPQTGRSGASAGTQRLDLHNASVDLAAALRGLCGFTHLPSGRVCALRHRHPGSCQLRIGNRRGRALVTRGRSARP